jgi:glucose/arabinose dehydrogenase
MRRLALLLTLAAGLAAPAAADAAPALVKVGDFSAPVYVAGSPLDSHRLFVVEQTGRVQLVVDGRRQDTPFLDLSADTAYDEERGLLSIAFPADYQSSRRFYVYLTARPGGQIQVREYLRSATDPNHADPASGRTVLAIDHPRVNHNGGQLQFGPDGKLWIGTGDGGDRDDPDFNAQDPSRLLGKLLRKDPLAAGAPEVFAIGLRNPWRFSFDRVTGDLVIADVGQDQYEEIDFAPAPGWRGAGANYGWPCFEGFHAYDTTRCSSLTGDVKPVLERAHGTGVCSITGGYVVRDRTLPSLYGRYLYGDFCAGQLRSFTAVPGHRATDDRALGLQVPSLSSFGEDAAGHIYATSLDGPVYRLSASGG